MAAVAASKKSKAKTNEKDVQTRCHEAWYALHDVLVAGSKSNKKQLTEVLTGVASAMGGLGRSTVQRDRLIHAWTKDTAMGPILDGCWNIEYEDDERLGYMAPEFKMEFWKQIFVRATTSIMLADPKNNWMAHADVINPKTIPDKWIKAIDPKTTAKLGKEFTVYDWIVYKFEISA
jgi:hypothetical protein